MYPVHYTQNDQFYSIGKTSTEPRTANDLQTEIARLEPFQVMSRSQVKTEEFVKFEAEAFYKNY
ncbi:hypothetical protein METHB2_50067 [Candidatus Methylobacter favarea]|uniref:Uncharacterized protein n=1 Tax=Candidatus Methylobacter favarea TaxID=2707345 RepID=A0A8S0XTN8_9GAMM|nr:hypothetical protein METHB2_50067 [Candidatus Methylobacter favarea]